VQDKNCHEKSRYCFWIAASESACRRNSADNQKYASSDQVRVNSCHAAQRPNCAAPIGVRTNELLCGMWLRTASGPDCLLTIYSVEKLIEGNFQPNLGGLNPSTDLRSSLVGRPERSAFQSCVPLTVPIEFFNRIDSKRTFAQLVPLTHKSVI